MKHEDIIKWYQKASIFVLTSFIEAFPVVTLEALSCETPVIATNVGGNVDVIRNYENGILVPPKDSVKLAEALQYLLDNKNVRERMGKVGRITVINNFSLNTSARKLNNIYKSMIDWYQKQENS